jgi:predicted HicB family RNase H-like nuclease
MITTEVTFPQALVSIILNTGTGAKENFIIRKKIGTFIRKINCMDTKLTLSMDETVIKRAKQYAKKNNTSLSKMVENYLKRAASNPKKGPEEIHPLINELTGVIKFPKGYNEKEEYHKRIIEKYK